MIRLAEKNLWILAYALLKNINFIIQAKIHLHKIDAATVLLFAEIYLANQRIIEAFTLLKRELFSY